MEITDLEKEVVLRIRKKLQLLECSLLSNNDEWWIKELLLMPGTYRLQLFEWILRKLEYHSVKLFQKQCSTEKHEKALLQAFMELGLCKSDDINLITGKAKKRLHLPFWERLLDLPLKKLVSSQHNDLSEMHMEKKKEISDLQETSSHTSQTFISSEYERNCDFIRDVSTRGTVKALQEKKVNFLPDVNRDMKSILSRMEKNQFPSLTDLRANKHSCKARTNESALNSLKLHGRKVKTNKSALESVKLLDEGVVFSLESDEQRHMNTKIKSAIEVNVQISKKFLKFSEKLKFVSNFEDVASDDIGMTFKELHLTQANLSQILNSLDVAKSEEKLRSDSNNLVERSLSDSSLEKYIETLRQRLKSLETTDISMSDLPVSLPSANTERSMV